MKLREYMDKNVGRYPKGYRHFENYENYKIEFPGATIEEYHNESKSNFEMDMMLIK